MEMDSRLSCCLCSRDEGTTCTQWSRDQRACTGLCKGSLGTSSYQGKGLANHPQWTKQTAENQQRSQGPREEFRQGEDADRSTVRAGGEVRLPRCWFGENAVVIGGRRAVPLQVYG